MLGLVSLVGLFRTCPELVLWLLASMLRSYLHTQIRLALDNYVPAMIRETNENVDELAQTTGKKKKDLLLKGHILTCSMKNRRDREYVYNPNYISRSVSQSGDREQRYLPS